MRICACVYVLKSLHVLNCTAFDSCVNYFFWSIYNDVCSWFQATGFITASAWPVCMPRITKVLVASNWT